MKQKLILASLIAASIAGASLWTSCSTLAKVAADKGLTQNLPPSLKTQVDALLRRQKQLVVQYSAGTRKMLQGYALVAESIGMEKEAAIFRAEAKALGVGSSFDDVRKSVSRTNGARNAVRSKLASADAAMFRSKAKFAQGVETRNEAYRIELSLSVSASRELQRGIEATRTATPMQKVFLTSQLEPLFYYVRDIPSFLAAERKFNEECKNVGKKYDIPVPAAKLPTPDLNNVSY